jgi:hypothetical protein
LFYASHELARRCRRAWRLLHKPPTDPVRRSVMGRSMLRAVADGQHVGRARRQRNESRYVSHQLGSTAFRTPLCNSLHGNRKLTRRFRLGRRADRRQDDRTVGLGIRDAWHWARSVDDQMKDGKERSSDDRIGEQDREWLADAVSVEVDRVS